jgi:hypothetical protein
MVSGVALTAGKQIATGIATKVATEILKNVWDDAQVKLPIGSIELLFTSNVSLRESMDAEQVERVVMHLTEQLGTRRDWGGIGLIDFKTQKFWIATHYEVTDLNLVDSEEEIGFLDGEETEFGQEWETAINSITFSALPRKPRTLADSLPGYELVVLLSNLVVNVLPCFSPDRFLYVYGDEVVIERLSEFLFHEKFLTRSMEVGREPRGSYAKFRNVSDLDMLSIVQAIQLIGGNAIIKWVRKRHWRKQRRGVL